MGRKLDEPLIIQTRLFASLGLSGLPWMAGASAPCSDAALLLAIYCSGRNQKFANSSAASEQGGPKRSMQQNRTNRATLTSAFE